MQMNIDRPRVLPRLFHLLCLQAKQEHVLFANLLTHLDVGAVVSADDEAAIHCELHVAAMRGRTRGRKRRERRSVESDLPCAACLQASS